MKTLDEIRQLMAAGDTALADEALKELLAKEPDNLQAKMLYGACRQLLGDEETFKRIHDELAPVMERLEKKDPKAETVSQWKKHQKLWEYLIAGGLVLAGVGAAALYFGKDILNLFGKPEEVRSVYAGPGYYTLTKYAGPPRHELKPAALEKKSSVPDENAAAAK